MNKIRRITVLYDNTSTGRDLKPAHGFACVIRTGKMVILFDTGGKADILISNMKKLNIRPNEITDIFISHIHWDHTGGLFGFLAKNKKARVVVPASFSEAYKGEIRESGAKVLEIGGFTKIAKDLYSTGEMGRSIIEQALIIDTPEGMVVVTGCAHPGIISIIKKAKKNLSRPVRLVAGGFHLYDKDKKEISKIIAEFKTLRVKRVAPSHCTGEKAIEMFKAEYGGNFVPLGTGARID